MTTSTRGGASAVLAAFLLLGCGGNYSGAAVAGGGSSGGGNVSGGSSYATPQAYFAAQVEPNIGYCRTCHIPGGVADTPGTSAATQGNLFLLSSDSGQDYDSVMTAWTNLGKGVAANKLLTNPSDPAQNHSGGQPWPQGSQGYQAMYTILSCWDNPSGCAALLSSGGAPVAQQQPLLGSSHAKTVWASYCEGQPDDAPLPPDPRSLVVPGVNPGKAVYFNAYWEDCHSKLPASEQHPKTCGAWRSRASLGQAALVDTLASGNTSATDFDNTWKKWGLSSRPANFEQMYTLRYGLNAAPFSNPYPLPGEDPSKTNGGSGQLPLGLRQLKDTNGQWTGKIGSVQCFGCHGGQIGDPSAGEKALTMANLGLGNSNHDTVMEGYDSSALEQLGIPISLDVLNLGVTQRGQNNAVGAFELLFMLLDYDSLAINPNVVKLAYNSAQPHPTGEAQDPPAWWNYGHRPRKFFDAGVSNDGTRIIMAAGVNQASVLSLNGKTYRTSIDQYDDDIAAYLMSLQSPTYPGPVNTQLAEQGAILFHTKNLWAQPGNANKPRPLGGNGSCAGCHGAYSPQFVNDAQYLDTPALEGIAGHISPLNVIGTDRARADELSPYLRDAYSTTFWAFPDGQPGYVAPGTEDLVTQALDDGYPPAKRVQGACGWEREVIGYQAPPLYGVWATGPYFHNGSVPTVEQVLNSSERPQIWRRKLQTIGPVTGFDQRLGAAYDYDRLGWQHDVLTCSQIPGSAAANCNPVNPTQPSTTELVYNFLESSFNWSALLAFPNTTPNGIDQRLVYDTRKLGNGNAGHDFTDVLTDQERAAIIEYLKTL